MSETELDALAETTAPLPPITEEEWKRILAPHFPGGRPRKVRFLIKLEQRQWAGDRVRKCLNCNHASGVKGDPRRGFCLVHSFMVSDAYPVLCRNWIPST